MQPILWPTLWPSLIFCSLFDSLVIFGLLVIPVISCIKWNDYLALHQKRRHFYFMLKLNKRDEWNEWQVFTSLKSVLCSMRSTVGRIDSFDVSFKHGNDCNVFSVFKHFHLWIYLFWSDTFPLWSPYPSVRFSVVSVFGLSYRQLLYEKLCGNFRIKTHICAKI